MKKRILLVLTILILICANCFSQNKKQMHKGGFLNQKGFITEIPFKYINKHLFITVTISNNKYTFLFDTGSELSLIDTEISKNIAYIPKKNIELSGSSIKKQEVNLIEIPNIKISNLDFERTFAIISDLTLMKKNYPDLLISGVIGNNLMRKTNWQIDYKRNVIRISDNLEKFEIPKPTKTIKLGNKSYGLGYIETVIESKKHKFIFDTGSNGRFTTNSSFGEFLKNRTIDEKKSKQTVPISKIKLGAFEFENETLSLEQGVSSLIGNRFFENYTVTIDWQKNILYLSEN